MKIVVIGGVAGGGSAAARAKRHNHEASVLMLEESAHISYAACGIPYFLSGDVKEASDLKFLDPKKFQETRGVEVRIGHRVLKIDKEKKEVLVKDLEKGEEYKENYDRLVIATGARPFVPPIEGKDLKGVFTLRSFQDGLDLAGAEKFSRVVIVGGGSIGCEMAETYLKLGREVTIIEKKKQILPFLDPEMAEIVENHLREKGVKIELGKGVKEIKGEKRVEEVITDDGSVYPADICLLALGVRPETSLAEEAGLELGARGALGVNEYMETSHPDIYGAGDCCETIHLLTGEKTWIPLGTTANKQGRTAGTNAAGGKMTFWGILGTAQVKVCDLDIARTGLGEEEAKAQEIDVISAKIETHSNAGYYPDVGSLHLKIIAAPDGKILGAQAVGFKGVDKRIDVLATAIHNGMWVDELEAIDLGYAPPYSVPIDPIMVAGSVLEKKIQR